MDTVLLVTFVFLENKLTATCDLVIDKDDEKFI